MPTVNYIAVLLSAVASMVLGFLWYGPLFGKMWMKFSGQKEMGDRSQAIRNYGLTFVASLVMAYVLAALLSLTKTVGIMEALKMAFWSWLGFQATILLGSVFWERKSWNLYFLNVAYWLVNLLVIAAVLSYL